MNHLIISTAKSEILFPIIYIFTILLVTGVFIQKGLKQRNSFLGMWFITTSGVIFFLMGIHLFPLSTDELKTVLLQEKPVNQGEKSVLGGLLVVPGLIIAILWLKKKISLVDQLTVPFILGVGLQNIGCLFAGCCYGKQSILPWSIRYSVDSPAFAEELRCGLLHSGETASLSLHPVQLYLLLGCFLAAFLAWKIGKYLHAPLSRFLMGWLLYSLLRFSMEFLRDPSTNHGLGNTVFDLKLLQWILLATVVIIGIIVLIREYRYHKPQKSYIPDNAGISRYITLFILLFALNLYMRNLFGFTEKLILNLSLIFASFLLGWKLIKTFTSYRFRIVSVLSVLVVLLLTAQNYIPKNKNEKITYLEVGSVFQTGQFYNQIQNYFGEVNYTDCNGNQSIYSNYKYYQTKNSFTTGGLSFSKTESYNKFKMLKYGTNLMFGSDKAQGLDTVYNKNISIISLYPYLKLDWHYFGVTGGLRLGNFHYAERVTKDDKAINKLSHELKNQHLLPSLNVRLGPNDIFYLEGFFVNQYMFDSPLNYYGLSLGTGLGRTDGTSINAGITSRLGFIRATVPVRQNYFIDAFYGFPANDYDPGRKTSQFSVGLHYRFNYKTITASKVENKE